MAGADLVRTDEAEAAGDVIGSDDAGDVVIRPHAVLQGEDESVRGEHRG